MIGVQGHRRGVGSALAIVMLAVALLPFGSRVDSASAVQPFAARDGVQEMQTLYQSLGGGRGVLGDATSGVLSIAGPTGAGLGVAYAAGSIYWTERFGAVYVTGDVLRRYFAAGGAAGEMGWPVANPSTTSGGTAQAFERASIYQATGASALAVGGAILQRYHAMGGSAGLLGWPTSGELPTGPGSGQAFQSGSIFASSTGAYSVTGRLRDAYFARGGATGSLGWPSAQPACSADGTECSQTFQQRALVADALGATWSTTPAILAAFTAAGGSRTVGSAASDVLTYAVHGGGTAQSFGSASIFASAAGAFAVAASMRAHYFSTGGAEGRFGWPIDAARCTTQACVQTFQGSQVTVSAAGSASDTASASIAATAQANRLGAATSAIALVVATTSGSAQAFVGGSVFASRHGTYAVTGAVRDRYFMSGGSAGSIGWPVAASTTEADGRLSQRFEAGTIYATVRTAVFTPVIAVRAFEAAGGARVLGSPSSEPLRITAAQSGFGVVADIASIYWRDDESSAHVVSGGIRDFYFAAGGATGSLAWPTGTMTCQASTCRQSFQGGTVVWDSTSGGRLEAGGFQAELISLVNARRANAGLPPVSAHPGLQTMAQSWSDRMAAAQSMVHSTTFCNDTLAMGFRRCAENIARTGSSSAAGVMDAWMNSAGHRANILNPNLTSIGVGLAQAADGRWYWTQNFGG